MENILYYTKSVCPVCLCELTAEIGAKSDGIYMEKVCPEHGAFSTLIWTDTGENYMRWLRFGGLDTDALPKTAEAAETLFADGSLKDDACCQSASSALMTTNRCNMDCPVCFTRDKKEPLHEPDIDTCRRLMQEYKERAGSDAIIEFCGGEPTVRSDICALASLARDIGFDFIQLNTNGIKLAESAEFCRALYESGITTVYMGFDGISEKPYLAKYGKPMLEIKKAAVKNCALAGLAVVLVTCIIPGENDEELGGIIEFANANIPTVKGVYFQPISYFGIYPEDNIRRITIPDVIRKLSEQYPSINIDDFCPGAYEHPQCSFNACYMQDKQGALRPLTRLMPRVRDDSGVHRVRNSIRNTWLPGSRRMLTIGGMAFQDAWNIDIMRVQRCSVQIICSSGKSVPLCSKYLSGCKGTRALPGMG